MIRINEICDALLHVVGWKQNTLGSDLCISSAITSSESGVYYQQAHPLLTLENLSCVAPELNAERFPVYEPTAHYFVGKIVREGEKLYRAVKNSTGKQPSISDTYWVITNPFSEWLEDKTRASIIKVINRFCNDKSAKGAYKPLCENKILFDGTGRIYDVEPNKRNVVGFEIVPIRSKGVTTKINKIGLQFSKPGKYKLYLMQSGSLHPVKELEFTKLQPNTMEWFTIDDCYLPYVSDSTEAGGSWYLCYSQSELPEGSQAIRKDYDWSKGPCNGCSRSQYTLWSVWSKFLEIHPFFVNEELVNGTSFNEDFNEDFTHENIRLWDVKNNQYIYDTNFGINLDISVSCDITDFIISQRVMFYDVLMKQMAVDMLREFVYNPNVRTNRNTMNMSKVDILYEVDGDSSSMKQSGLSYQLDLAFKAIELNTEGIDRICLPCKNGGIKYRTV